MFDQWRERRISEVAEVFDGPHATPEKTDIGPWFLSISSLQDGRLVLDESAHLSEDDFGRWTKRVTPQAGDVLFSYETRLGEAALMPVGVRACLGRRMGLLRPRGDVNPRFLLYAYLGPRFQAEIDRRTVRGATVDRIPLNELPSWPIQMPDRPTQDAIAEVLGAPDDKINSNERIIVTSERALRARFDREVVSDKDRDAPSAVLGDILTNVRDVRQPTDVVPDTPYVGLEHLIRGSVIIRDHGIAADVTSGKFVFQRNDILFGKLRPYFRKVALAFDSGVCSSDVLVLRSREVSWLPLALMITSSQPFIDYCDGASSGTRMPRINWRDMASYSINSLTQSDWAAFNEFAMPLLDRMDAAAVESRLLAALREALLPPLLTGELRVRDAEAVVEEAL